MDWYNPAYWANNKGAYEDWMSVYPPFSFLFQRLLTRPSCYISAPEEGRRCDPQGYIFLSVIVVINFLLSWWAFHKRDSRTAFPRAVAVGLGSSMLWGWERGNLVIPCYAFFIIAYGDIVRSNLVRIVCAAITVNFKPYLILLASGRLLHRDWVWLERFALGIAAVYLVSYGAFGSGDPFQLVHNLLGFATAPLLTGFALIEFTTTYNSLLQMLNSSFPIMQQVGSHVMEGFEFFVPIAIRGGLFGVAAVLGCAAVKPSALRRSRITALVLVALFSAVASEGPYSFIFFLFYLFLERLEGPGVLLAIVAAYIWCLPIDINISGLTYQNSYSFITNESVKVIIPITVGQLVRPALILLMEYGLIIASIRDLWRHLHYAPVGADEEIQITPLAAPLT